MKNVIVVGGGAAGMMAAAAAAKNGNRVTLLEKNEKLGKKIYITGKGRCNVTNACDTPELFDHICTNPKFLYSAIYGFDNFRTMQFFEDADCKLKTERGNRVFPVSDHSSDVIAALQRELKRDQVNIRLHSEVKEILFSGEIPKITGVLLKNGEKINGDAVIIATGGLSYPSTGSTGDGYRFARKAGHRVTGLYPSLVSFHTKEDWCYSLAGLSLKNVTVSLTENGEKIFEEQGEMLFTHEGVSGPLILTASTFYSGMEGKDNIKLNLDLKPVLSDEQLDRRLVREFEPNMNKQFKNCLNGLFPSKLIPVMISLSGICPEKKIHEITKEERQVFCKRIKNVPLSVTGTGGFSEAVITRGGVSVKEVNPSTMESRLVKGLFFAGEILDTDACTGGYNLQIAWSTGHLAGESV